MPQKRNPGILNRTRRDASTAITLAMGTVMQAPNPLKWRGKMNASLTRLDHDFDKLLTMKAH